MGKAEVYSLEYLPPRLWDGYRKIRSLTPAWATQDLVTKTKQNITKLKLTKVNRKCNPGFSWKLERKEVWD